MKRIRDIVTIAERSAIESVPSVVSRFGTTMRRTLDIATIVEHSAIENAKNVVSLSGMTTRPTLDTVIIVGHLDNPKYPSYLGYGTYDRT